MVINQEKIKDGYKFIVDSKVLDISSFLKYLSERIEIKDIDIQNESIDDIIVNLYREYQV